ncbi:MAG: TonB-dependent receptor [Rhodospirillaceae bacterium]|nr:TonB-dependent receptor [Rhodospirillaceae bacterium]
MGSQYRLIAKLARTAAVLAALALPHAMFAQVQQIQLEEIIVTATKREESLQDIPLSIVAQTGELLNELNLVNAVDMATFIPNLTMRDTVIGIATVIRGVGTVGGNPAFEPSVASFIDGAYLGRDRTTTTAFLDLDRIEIVRGPQPLFAGQNAVAGALNLISRRPGDALNGYVRTGIGTDEENQLEFALGGPVTEGFGARIAAIVDERGGWMQNGDRMARSSEDTAVRGTLEFSPSDYFTATLMTTWYESMGNGGTTEYAYCAPNDRPGPGMRAFNLCNANPSNGIDDVSWDGVDGPSALEAVRAARLPPFINFAGMGFPAGAFVRSEEPLTEATERRTQDGTRVNLVLEYDAENFSFISQTNRIQFDFNQLTDPDATAVNFYPVPIFNSYEATQQEFRVQSAPDSAFEWMAGVYWQESVFDNNNLGAIIAAAPGPRSPIGVTPVADNRFAPPFPNDTYFDEEAEWLSGFVNFGFNLGENFTLDIGARVTQVDKTGQMQNGTGHYELNNAGQIVSLLHSDNGPGCEIGTETNGFNAFLRPPRIDPNTEVCVAGRVDNSSTDPQIQLSWDVTDQSMLFLRYAEGFKSGGFSVGMSAPDVEQFVYHPEEAETLEIGVKSLLADARLELNIVAFQTDFANRQVSALAPVFFGAPEFIIQNAAASSSTGVEFDGRWAASENLAITFSGAVLDSTYDSYPGAACNGYKRARRQDGCAVNRATFFDAAGLDTALATPGQLTLGARSQHPLGNGYRVVLSGTLALLGHSHNGFNQIEEPEYQNGTEEHLNLRVALQPVDLRWDVALYADNATDNRRFLTVASDALGYDENILVTRVQGATYGVQARWNFGSR